MPVVKNQLSIFKTYVTYQRLIQNELYYPQITINHELVRKLVLVGKVV